MATGPRYFVPFRRRREGKTDYYARMRLVVSEDPRMVVRKTNRYIIIQLVEASPEGDLTRVTANSKELGAFGYTGSMANTPAAYLTGVLFAVKAKKAGFGRAILDIGLHRASKGARVFGALKGAIDGGLDVPHDAKIFPEEGRWKGEHIMAYRKDRAGDLAEQVSRVMAAIQKEGV
ncbi:MAG: 50S ribosomal protein L18 [Methanomicrobiales archaeon]|nr:50S ribosomal protein L18 [Methanomicrobiales archaeon]